MDLKRQRFTFLLTMLLSMMGVEAFAHNIEVANADGVTIYYTSKAGSTELKVSHCSYSFNSNKYTGEVVIPSSVTYNGTTYSVTSIEDEAFYDCSDLTSVTIPNSVTSIESSAFNGCSGLTSVTIGNSVTSIGNSAFRNCTGLTSVTIGNSVTSIESSAFFQCSSLTSVTIGNSVTSIGQYAFSGCSSLTSVIIPNSVTSIWRYAFYNTAWYNNQPDGIVYAGKVAYNYKGTMPSNTSIVLEEGTTGIADDAFSGCTDLTSVTIPSSVTRIGYDAFSGCTGLTSITIPNSVTRIESSTFSGCTGLTSVTIPNSVTNIGSSTFSRCSGLTNITIPSSVTSIGDYAFLNCSGLSSITSLNPVPPVCNSKTFKDVDMTIPLYVPKGSVLKYKAADEWRNFVIIREIGQDDIYLTINDGAHGSVKLKVDETNPYVTLKIEAENGWLVHSVTLNGENVKGEVAADGSYTTPAINANSTLGIVYAQVGTSARALSASRLALTAHDGSMLITGTNGSEQVSVYTLDSKCVESLTATAGQTKVSLASGQVYIVKVDDSTFKISM